LIGADVTHTMEDEYWGATYTEGGVQKSLEAILKDHGFNAARIDTFVDPTAPGGFADMQPEAFRGLAQTITLAQRIKAQGMYFLLDLHMSDTWTNPGAQTTPSAWAGYSLSQLETAVSAYVADAVNQLIAAGARPDMVQFGNEITNGMMWEVGRISDNDFSNLATLLKAGINAVKSVDESILVMLHIEKCNNLNTTRWWLDGVLAEGVDFDILGQSCYGPTDSHAGYQGQPSEWTNVFNTIASEYPDLKFAIAEYSSEQRAANDVIFNLPNNRGIGTFNWDPMRYYETHPNDPLFSTESLWSDYHVIPEKMAIYDQIAADYAAAGR
jgi:arabinogalactan endo-1,4-beta-galactosidase